MLEFSEGMICRGGKTRMEEVSSGVAGREDIQRGSWEQDCGMNVGGKMCAEDIRLASWKK